MRLTDTQKKLAEQLLLTVIKRESVVEYNELANRINPPIFHRQVGREIGEISKLCKQLGLPLLSAKVVSKGRGTAGVGFYDLMMQLGIDTKGKTERELFSQELKRIRECTEWYKLADYLDLDLDLPRLPENDDARVPTISSALMENTSTILKETDGTSKNIVSIFDQTTSLEKEIVELPLLPEELVVTQCESYTEGTKKQIIVNAYERNPNARYKCIQIRGSKCVICGFDFGSFYGQDLEGKIHIHHIKPLHLIDDTYEVDPEHDLVPVCPNCHMVLHSKQGGTYTVGEVQNMVAKSKMKLVIAAIKEEK
ncbi:MAG: HNH endonuclease [Desulfitobacterium hafniense]|nr:HNH endonuclease [Desulfitobacterium hafniense]